VVGRKGKFGDEDIRRGIKERDIRRNIRDQERDEVKFRK